MDTLKVGDIIIAKEDVWDCTAGKTYQVAVVGANNNFAVIDDNGCLNYRISDSVTCWARSDEKAPQPTAKKVASDGTPSTSTYYKLPAHATELRHLISHKKMNFHIGNIFKAAYRLGEKEGIDHRYDLKKIISMAEFELEELDRAEGKA